MRTITWDAIPGQGSAMLRTSGKKRGYCERVPVIDTRHVCIDELEDKLAQVVVVVLGIAFLGQAVTWDGQRDLPGLGVATALVIAALSYHLRRPPAALGPSRGDAP